MSRLSDQRFGKFSLQWLSLGSSGPVVVAQNAGSQWSPCASLLTESLHQFLEKKKLLVKQMFIVHCYMQKHISVRKMCIHAFEYYTTHF